MRLCGLMVVLSIYLQYSQSYSVKLRLLTEWIYAEDRDSELYNKISKIRFALLRQPSLDIFIELVDTLEPLVYKITIDEDYRPQYQRDLLQNLLQLIMAAKKINSPFLIFQAAKDLSAAITSLLRDERDDRHDY